MKRYYDYVFDLHGNAQSGVAVEVRLPDATKASLYDAQGVAIANPVTSGPSGLFEFYVANGKYDLAVTGAGINKTITSIEVFEYLAASAALDFASIAAAGSANLTIAVTGAVVGQAVALGLPAAPAAGLVFNAFVSAAGTVTVRASNLTAAAVDPASATYKVAVL